MATRDEGSMDERWKYDAEQGWPKLLRPLKRDGTQGFPMQKYEWSKLKKLQIGKYAEYFAMMELTRYGFQVYSTEVDDRGIDFVTRYECGPFIEVQVKSARGDVGYIFMEKDKFLLRKELYFALVLFSDGQLPTLYLMPSTEWERPHDVFASRDYAGKQSKPEWGLNISHKNMHVLEKYRFEQVIDQLKKKPREEIAF